jgi:hypothetical protein
MENHRTPPPEAGPPADDTPALPSVDPEIVVGTTLVQAEVLRIQAEVARSSQADPGQQSPLRDLSPLGR